MDIKKINLSDIEGILYEDFLKNRVEDSAARIQYRIDTLVPGMTKTYGGDEKSAYHLLVHGEASFKLNEEALKKVTAGQSFCCEPEETMHLEGDGRVLSMIMDRGMRGTIRLQSLEKESTFKVGEAIGDSCMLLTSLDKDICIECNGETYTCAKGEAVLLRIACKEYARVRLTAESHTPFVVFNSVKMFDADFGKYIGIRTIEQGYGTCKVRLDIQKQHMNPIGSVHGGTIFTMADAASGIAASTTGGLCTTVSSHVEFLNAAMNVKYLVAEAKPKKIGKKIRTFTVDITDEKENLIGSAEFVFFCLQN